MEELEVREQADKNSDLNHKDMTQNIPFLQTTLLCD
jgi:hypothetical protein